MKFLFFLFLISFIICNKKLILVQVITRHGDRTPLKTLPNQKNEWNCDLNFYHLSNPESKTIFQKVYIPNRQQFNGNCLTGQLTSKGFQQHFLLGQKLRKKYFNELNFIPEKYDPKLIYLRTTDKQRTRNSVYGNLLGLFPIDINEEKIEVLDVNTVDLDYEYMHVNKILCPKLKRLLLDLENSSFWKERKEYKFLHEEVVKIFNDSSLLDTSLRKVRDNIYCTLSHGKPIPEGISYSLAAELVEETRWQIETLFVNKLISKLSVGLLIKDILEAMQNKIVEKIEYKYMFYSGHDTTLAPLLSNFNVFDGSKVYYSSFIIFELYSDDSNHFFVRFIYNDEVYLIPGCKSTFCEFETFIEIAKKVIPINFTEECV
ncbi:lysophosphatidic acid phosphatase type 6 [Anaeramoeba ignava]|uniref:Lysophosphatidic acid phosphatase type 6 n=1 Tax=Anaeramoeba ignava TaxID=1746090 RepID=A0A9Q0RDN8_ANAIG|nr:lysophosphatidic acid phosphatase type 6 [Anaeramoeba ignava]